MGLGRRVTLSNTMVLNHAKVQVQKQTVWARVDSGREGIGLVISGAGWTMCVWENHNISSTKPMDLKF